MKILIAAVCLAIAVGALAETLPAGDSELIEGAGIPIYEEADFVYGNSSVGFRFATDKSPETVREWYREQLADWSLMDEMGIWVLYDGPAGLGFGALMSSTQVTISQNDELPDWHSLDESMTTEIVIMIVK